MYYPKRKKGSQLCRRYSVLPETRPVHKASKQFIFSAYMNSTFTCWSLHFTWVTAEYRLGAVCILHVQCQSHQCSFLPPGDQHMSHINISKCAECVQNLCWRRYWMALLSQRPLWVMLNQYINAHHRFSLQLGQQSPLSLHYSFCQTLTPQIHLRSLWQRPNALTRTWSLTWTHT